MPVAEKYSHENFFVSLVTLNTQLSMAFTFQTYSTPLPGVLYSEKFFQETSISQCVDLVCPKIRPAGSLTAWVWESSTPTDSKSLVVRPDEEVPHFDDIRTVANTMQAVFPGGICAVLMTWKGVNGQPHPFMVHMSKVS